MSDERNIITGEKKQISIGTFETREEALNALSLYSLQKSNKITNREAQEIAPDLFVRIQEKTQRHVPTFKEIYDILDNEEFSKKSLSTRRAYASWIKCFESIFNRQINTITLADLQFIFDNLKIGNGGQAHAKALCSKIFKYAVVHQHIKRDDDYTSYIRVVDPVESTKHYAFSVEEIKQLKQLDTPEAHILLIYIYTGCRKSELMSIDRSNIHIDEPCDDDGAEMYISYIVTGSKTEAGRNRIIPIHKDIKKYVIDELLKDGKRLVDYKRNAFEQKIILKLNKELNMKHTMHDTRKTFASLCQMNHIDIYIRKKVLGRKMNDITFDVYTNESKNILYKEINKIKI
jgi:integrase